MSRATNKAQPSLFGVIEQDRHKESELTYAAALTLRSMGYHVYRAGHENIVNGTILTDSELLEWANACLTY